MGRPSDQFRVLRLLYEAERLSHKYIQRCLNLAPPSYRAVRGALEREGFVESGSDGSRTLSITAKGKAEYHRKFAGTGKVDSEKELYEPLCELLREREDCGLALNVGSLKRRGAWKNPDVIEVVARPSALGLGTVVRVVSYEVKRWNASWSLSSVFEAASHAGFCHASYLVLEWARDIEFSHDYLDVYGRHILAGCQRFGLGLYVLRPERSAWRLERALLAADTHPDEVEVHEYLEEVFRRRRVRAAAEELRQLATGIDPDEGETEDEDEEDD